MTQEEYATRRQVLDRQLEAGIELLRQAHQAQVRALEVVWMTNPAAEVPPRAAPASAVEQRPVPPPAPPSDQRRKGGAWALYNEVFDALDRLGPDFVRSDVCRVLGYEPDRTTLQRALKELQGEGLIALAAEGRGRVPARWVKRPRAKAAGAQTS